MSLRFLRAVGAAAARVAKKAAEAKVVFILIVYVGGGINGRLI